MQRSATWANPGAGMEIILILVAVVALAISGVVVSGTMARTRRPPLRLPHEEHLDDGDEERLMESLEPPRPSPIDRSGPVLDLEPIERPPDPRLPPGNGSR